MPSPPLALTRRSALLGAAALPLLGAMRPARRPNIVLLLADDWSWQSARAVDPFRFALSGIARLRAEGMSFTNAFAAAPSCTASRGAILTGRYPWQLEEGANLASTLPAKFPVYPDLLERAGYHVGFVGKGWAPGQIAPGGRTRNPAGDLYPDVDAFLAARDRGEPFCLWVGAHDPHRPYEPDRGRREGIMVAQGTLPPTLPDVELVRRDVADYLAGVRRFDDAVTHTLARLSAAGVLDDTLVVATGDNGWPFPRGKASLYDAGTHVPLTIRWPGVTRPGSVSDALVSLADLAPTFLAAAGLPPARGMSATSLVPLLHGRSAGRPYVLTGMERHMDGRTEPGTGYPMRAIRTRRHLYIRNFAPDRWPAGDPPRHPTDLAALATDVFAGFADIDAGRAKAWLVMHRDDPGVRRIADLAFAKRPPAELYDVAADPDETRNLAADPAHRALAARLDRTLAAALARTGDPRVVGDGGVFDRYPSRSDPGFGRPRDF